MKKIQTFIDNDFLNRTIIFFDVFFFKKNREIIILVLALFLGINSHAQCSYRIKDQKGQYYLLPPKINKLIKSNGNLKNKFKNITIEIDNLSSDYISSTSSIDYAKLILNSDHKSTTANAFDINRSSSTSFKIDINFEKLFNDEHPNKAFKDFSIDLLIKISASKAGKNWPSSISQNIVEKIFEIIPIPESVSLTRYAFHADDNYFFVLLNPKIWLLVDATERIRPRWKDVGGDNYIIDPSYWQMNYYGQSVIKFYRNKKGSIKQLPFINFEAAKTLPVNDPKNPLIQCSTLQSSSGDIQLTEGLKNKKFVTLFQSFFKGNNSETLSNLDEFNDNSYENSQLLFTDSLDANFFTNCITSSEPALKCSSLISSTFGSRNLIVPVIPISLNGIQEKVCLNTNLNILKQIGMIPNIKSITIYRLWNGKYVKIKTKSEDLTLLPNDKLEF